jgi:hypothetical protein
MALAQSFYNAVFRRNSTTLVFVLASAFVFERVFNPVTDNYFNSRNAGVRSAWHTHTHTTHTHTRTPNRRVCSRGC